MARRIAKKVAPKIKAAAALSRHREGKAKKKRHDGDREDPIARGRAFLGLGEAVPRETEQAELDLSRPSEIPEEPRPYLGHPPHHEDSNGTGQYGLPERSSLAQTMEGYYDRYGPERNCGDMIAHILSFREQADVEQFVFDMTGKAWLNLNPGQRRMNAGNVIRGLVNRYDRETLDWLLSTPPR